MLEEGCALLDVVVDFLDYRLTEIFSFLGGALFGRFRPTAVSQVSL
jgi:hypothetical protein